MKDDGGVVCCGCKLEVSKLDRWFGENRNKGNFLSDNEWGDECGYVVCNHCVKDGGSFGGERKCEGNEGSACVLMDIFVVTGGGDGAI